jgi:histidinol phosphatase-like enzyme (inositol monophosphatase family)
LFLRCPARAAAVEGPEGGPYARHSLRTPLRRCNAARSRVCRKGQNLSADIDIWLAAALGAADAAGAVIRPLFRTSVAADTKSDQSPVTIADRNAELAMRGVLADRCPTHGILGEEYGLERPDASLRWVLDPVDGTRAFITGRPTFGCLIGLLDGDEPVLGVIDQPVTGERWIGVRGRPTVFSGGLGGRAGTRGCADLALAELSATSPAMFGTDLPRFEALAGQTRRTYWGGDCYAYGLLALGHVDVVVECDLKPWDWAALVPVVEGAGGQMTDWSGRKLRCDGDGRVIAVGDPRLLEAVVRALG